MIRYTLAYGSYYVVDGDSILNMVDEPALLITKEDADGQEMWCLHRHGNFDKLMPYYRDLLNSSRAGGLFGRPYIITGKFEVEDLNRVLDNNNYLKQLIIKLNLELN